MGFLSSLLGLVGFGVGIPIGISLGYFIFMYFEPTDVKDPIIRPLHDLDTSSLLDILPEIPLWIKHPDYERIDWLNKFISDMWPYLDKAICGIIRSTTKPIFAEYVGNFQIKSVDFERLSLGTLPPVIHVLKHVSLFKESMKIVRTCPVGCKDGVPLQRRIKADVIGIKVHETNENELVFEPVVRWAGNPNITLVLKLMFLRITVQLLDLQIFVAPRIVLKPLVPTFPCFASILVTLLEKPHVDFGLNLMGGDIMAVPGLYQFVQETVKKQVANLYLWPQTFEMPILDGSVGTMKKPVGILHVKVIRSLRLLKMDLLGTSDPYVQLSLSGERLPAKKTSVKMKNLNPEWNEDFKLTVKDPQSQVLQLHVFDWEKFGTHDKLGMQVVPLRLLIPHETKQFTLDLHKNTNPNDPQNEKRRGQLLVELTFNPFKEENERFSGPLEKYTVKECVGKATEDPSLCGVGLLLVTVLGAGDIEGKYHNNPYAVVLFKGEKKKTKVINKTRDPCWNEEFQFMLEEAPSKEKVHIEIMSKPRSISFRSKVSLGHVEINLSDVVYNGHINEKYHLINSRNGVIRVDLRWKVI